MTRFSIGSAVACSDGSCGDITRLVVDPVARILTHLVVETRERAPSGRLVPVDLVDDSTHDIRLRCTTAEFAALPGSEVSEIPASDNEKWRYDQEPVLQWPNYTRGPGLTNTGTELVYHRIPKGQVEVSRGDPVHNQGKVVGNINGLLVDLKDKKIAHLLLDEGHRWSKKQVAIPIVAVSAIDGGMQITLTKDEVRSLPSIDSDQEPS
jgi:sporulation protein YlmC with PRC-barrel domain